MDFYKRFIKQPYSCTQRRCVLGLGLAVVISAAALTVFAQAPGWWTNRAIIATNHVPNDFATVNQGQVKWLATQAKAEFDDKLQALGGAGTGITTLVNSFSPSNNYRVVNQGQLKNAVKPFYDRLWELGLTNCYPPHAGTPYPWSNNTNAPHHYALANIGQAKYAFSFDLSSVNITTNTDGDADGLPDWWEYLASGSRTGASPDDDPSGQGLTNAQRFNLGISPTQDITAITLTDYDIAFEAKTVESYRSKTVAFQDYASQTDATLPHVYFLTEEEHEELADCQTYTPPDTPGADITSHDILWQHDYAQHFDLANGFFAGSWSFSWHFIYEDDKVFGTPGSFSEYSSGAAQWTSNIVCSGHSQYSFNEDNLWRGDTPDLIFSCAYSEAWSNVSHNEPAPHADLCHSNGYGAGFYDYSRTAGYQDAPFGYAVNHITATTREYDIILDPGITLGNQNCTNGTQTFTLSQEFTTALLEQTVTGDLNRNNPFGSLDWGGKWSYNYYGQRTDTASSGPTACRQLLTGELELLERKSLYRVVVNTNQYQLQTGTYYRVNVAHIFSPISTNDMIPTTNSVLETHTWVAQYTGGSQLVFNAAGTLLDVPPSNGTVSVSAIKVQIIQPTGSADSIRNNWTNSWLSAPYYFWDFQTVSSNSVGLCGLTVSGAIWPENYSYGWTTITATAIGILQGTNGGPDHVPPADAPTNGVTGSIKLEALLGSVPTGVSDSKHVIVYKDHLARDMENFGVIQSCVNGIWQSPFGQILMNNVSRTWNCHGSSQHAYNGTGDGYASDLLFLDTWETSAPLNYPFSPSAIEEINKMRRGDIVTYHDSNKGLGHSATSLGGDLTWGANNAPLKPIIMVGTNYIPTSDSLQWAAVTVPACAADLAWKWPRMLYCWHLDYIVIHKKP